MTQHLKTNEKMREEWVKRYKNLTTDFHYDGDLHQVLSYWLNIITERENTLIDMFVGEMERRKAICHKDGECEGFAECEEFSIYEKTHNSDLSSLITWAKGLKK